MLWKLIRGALLLFFISTTATVFAEQAAVVFTMENSIFLTDTAGSRPVKLAEGNDPEVSPDGRFVAFTASSGKDGWGRAIAVLETATKKRTVFQSIPGENSYGPRWSPDGRALLFNHWDERNSNWVLGLVTVANGKFRVLAPELQGVYSPFWSADGKSVYAQDLETLYRIDAASGRVVERRPLEEVTVEAMVSSAVRFAVSPDGSMWLFDGEVEDTLHWLRRGEPLISAIFAHTPGDGRTRRLTSEEISAGHPAWFPGGREFLFAGYGPKEATRRGYPFALFRQSVDGGKATLFLKEGGSPSVSR